MKRLIAPLAFGQLQDKSKVSKVIFFKKRKYILLVFWTKKISFIMKKLSVEHEIPSYLLFKKSTELTSKNEREKPEVNVK